MAILNINTYSQREFYNLDSNGKEYSTVLKHIERKYPRHSLKWNKSYLGVISGYYTCDICGINSTTFAGNQIPADRSECKVYDVKVLGPCLYPKSERRLYSKHQPQYNLCSGTGLKLLTESIKEEMRQYLIALNKYKHEFKPGYLDHPFNSFPSLVAQAYNELLPLIENSKNKQ